MFFCTLILLQRLHFTNETFHILTMPISHFYLPQYPFFILLLFFLRGFTFLSICWLHRFQPWACKRLLCLSVQDRRSVQSCDGVESICLHVVFFLSSSSFFIIATVYDVLLHRIADKVDNFESLLVRIWDQYIFTIFLDPFHEHQMLEPTSFILILFKPFLILFTMGLVNITSTFRSLMLPCMLTFISIWFALMMHMKIFMEFPKFQILFFRLNNYLVLSLLNVGKFTLSTVLHKWNVHLYLHHFLLYFLNYHFSIVNSFRGKT